MRSSFSVEVAKDKIANLEAKATQLHTMRQMVDEAEAILRSPTRPLAEIGRLLHQSWMLKRELAGSVTTNLIDEIYDTAIAAGASLPGVAAAQHHDVTHPAPAKPADAPAADRPAMDHSQMDHGQMDHAALHHVCQALPQTSTPHTLWAGS